MELYQQFKNVLAEFGEKLQTELKLENGACSIPVNATYVVNLRYLIESDCVVLWSVLETWHKDELASARARHLLKLQDLGLGTHGFSIGLIREEHLLVAHDLRSADELPDVDHLAAWVDDLIDLLSTQEAYLRENFPPDEDYEEEEEGDEDDLVHISFLDDTEGEDK